GDAERREDLLDALDGAIEILLQLLVELLARGFVRGILLVAEGLPDVVHPAEVLGTVLGPQPEQEVRDAPRRRRVLAPPGRERSRDHREERPVDQRVAVNEE